MYGGRNTQARWGSLVHEVRMKQTAEHDGTELMGEVIARAQEGDRDALHFLYVRYADGVYCCIERIVRDPHDAEDLTQTVFIKLIKVIRRYEDRGLPFSAWINRVARNTALDHLRARRLVPCEDVVPASSGQEQLDQERLWSLRAALEELPAAQREVLVLRHFAGLSPSEIAERLGKSEGSVHGLHHRARGSLRSALLELEASPVTGAA
jgi:RNA polymerase sigma-70 factor, ECF subfamily